MVRPSRFLFQGDRPRQIDELVIPNPVAWYPYASRPARRPAEGWGTA